MPFLPPNQQRQSTEGSYRQSTVLIIRYDTRCYFNMLSKADISQLNLLHVTNNWKWKKEWRCAQKYRRQTDEMATWWLVWDWWDGYLMTGVRLMRWLPDDWCKRAEGFLVGTLHVRAAVSDNSRLKETATKLMSTASSQHFTSLQHCICHMLRHLQTHTTAKHKLCRSAGRAIGGMLIRLS